MKVTEFNRQEDPMIGKIREKELVHAFHVINLDGDKSDYKNYPELVDCRLYMGRSSSSSVVYCAIWIKLLDRWIVGRGNAGGYGYDKMSAAVDGALDSAGFKFDEGIGGVGNDAIKDALIAVCEHFGYNKERLYIVESYA